MFHLHRWYLVGPAAPACCRRARNNVKGLEYHWDKVKTENWKKIRVGGGGTRCWNDQDGMNRESGKPKNGIPGRLRVG